LVDLCGALPWTKRAHSAPANGRSPSLETHRTEDEGSAVAWSRARCHARERRIRDQHVGVHFPPGTGASVGLSCFFDPAGFPVRAAQWSGRGGRKCSLGK